MGQEVERDRLSPPLSFYLSYTCICFAAILLPGLWGSSLCAVLVSPQEPTHLSPAFVWPRATDSSQHRCFLQPLSYLHHPCVLLMSRYGFFIWSLENTGRWEPQLIQYYNGAFVQHPVTDIKIWSELVEVPNENEKGERRGEGDDDVGGVRRRDAEEPP